MVIIAPPPYAKSTIIMITTKILVIMIRVTIIVILIIVITITIIIIIIIIIIAITMRVHVLARIESFAAYGPTSQHRETRVKEYPSP